MYLQVCINSCTYNNSKIVYSGAVFALVFLKLLDETPEVVAYIKHFNFPIKTHRLVMSGGHKQHRKI